MTTATAEPRPPNENARTGVHEEAFETWLLLQQAYLLTYKAIDQALTKAAVSYAQAAVLVALKRAGAPLPLSRLARTLVQEAQSVTSLIDRLEAHGLVQRIPDRQDRRVIRVGLTADGERLLDAALPLAADAAQTALGDLDLVAIGALRAQMERIRSRSAATLGIAVGGAARQADTAGDTP